MLPKKHKIKTKEFLSFKKGRTFHSPHLTLRIYPAPQEQEKKFSFVVSKKIHKNSVQRNRLKRLGYRAVREAFHKTKSGFFSVFFFKKGAAALSYPHIKEEIVSLLKNANVV